MAASTNWKPAYDVAITVNGTELILTSGECSVEIEEFETTNTLSEGDYEFGPGVKKVSLRGSLVVDDDSYHVPTEKNLVAASYSDGGKTYSGQGRVTRVSRRGGGRGAFTADIEFTFSGAVTAS